MRGFRIVAIAMVLIMLLGGSIVSVWFLTEGSLPIPIASGALAALGASVLFLELQDQASA
jgi:hypothetical protein